MGLSNVLHEVNVCKNFKLFSNYYGVKQNEKRSEDKLFTR